MDANILRESEVDADIGRLDAAWAEPTTFAFVPDKSVVGHAWIGHALAQLPQDLRTGHFALLTSGSTGKPKLVIGQRTRSESLARVLDQVQLGAEVEETIVSLPLTYCYAFVNQWLWARVNDRRLVQTRGFSEPDHLREALQHADRAMLCMVGAQVPLLRRFMNGRSFPGVVRLHFAGGRFPQEHLDYLATLFPNALVFNNYGCAEAMPRLSLRRALGSNSARNIGRPISGVELKTADDGRLLFRSPFGARAFYDDGGLRLIGDGEWIETGDLGHSTGDGSWELEGRSNEVFKRYGEKVSLPQLLTTVHNAWGGEANFYRERDSAGEDGCVLVLAPHPEENQVRSILKAFRGAHPRPHWPLRIEGMGTLPKLANRKVDTGNLASAADKVVLWQQRI